MFAKRRVVSTSWLAFALVTGGLCGCARPPAPPALEEPVQAQKIEAPNPPSQPTENPDLSPPKLEQVREAVKRIFKDAVLIDSGHTPNFLVGDFNGDLSQDLAVVLKPAAGKLSDLNQEFPNWIAREPLATVLARTKPLAQPLKPSSNPAAGQTVRFEQNDILLAIIHGHGSKGWRDPEATQTHLMRDVVGSNMRILPSREAIKIYKGKKPFPSISGDLIQQTLVGQSGFLHFAGSIYSWYDPKGYEPVAVKGHSAMSRMR